MCSTVGMFSAVGDIMINVGRYREYHGRGGIILSTVGDLMMQVGNIVSIVGVFSTVGDTILCN